MDAYQFTESQLIEAGCCAEFARNWAGWYVDTLDGAGLFHDDVFKRQFSEADGPVKDNVAGPFETEQAALEHAIIID